MLFDMKAFGSRVKILRKAAGMTQEQLAEKLHISISHLAKIEIGSRMPSIDLLLEISGLFGVTVDDLLRSERQEILSPECISAQMASLAAQIADLAICIQDLKM